ncbi:MAG: DUF4339 domain-containing protein [Acidimicrobiia bacterium]|nr:DUF4339 domain-containing protein [Acidimicrobiia bacterium]
MAGFIIKREDGSTMGPFDQKEVRRLIALRKIGPDTLITQEGRRSWFRLRDVPALARECERHGHDLSTASAEPASSAAPPAFAVESVESPVAASTVAHASLPESIGLIDRILRLAFAIGRGASVLILLFSLVVMGGAGVLVAYALMPAVHVPPAPPQAGTMREFIEECARPPAQQQPDRGQRPRATALDPCGPYRARIKAAIRDLQVTDDAERVTCNLISELEGDDPSRLVDGLVAIASAHAARKPQEPDCSGADAYNWYVQDFMGKVAQRQAERAAQLAADAERRSWASIALGAAGSALVLLLSFLALPLLIQIERNTRRHAHS